MSLKLSNEITVKINCTIDELIKMLEEKGYEFKEKYYMEDHFFIPETIDIKGVSVRDILSKAVLVRDISDKFSFAVKKLTFKRKRFDECGNILEQDSVNCDVGSIEDAREFMKAIGYTEIMIVEEEDNIYWKDDFEIAIKDVKGGENLIEVETDEKFDTIEKLTKKVGETGIPIDTSNYFVKKAEIELEKIIKKI